MTFPRRQHLATATRRDRATADAERGPCCSVWAPSIGRGEDMRIEQHLEMTVSESMDKELTELIQHAFPSIYPNRR